MTDRRPLPIGVGALAGGVAGVLVGTLDGLRAAGLVGASISGALLTAVLTAAVDGVVGVLGGALLESIGRLAVWGRQARSPLFARAAALVVIGVVAAGVTYATAVATGARHNRFL